MADQVNPKIHPAVVDPKTPPPEGSMSEKGDLRRTFPVVHPKKRRSFCCRCFCWTAFLLILLLIIIAAVLGILYLAFHPKVPSYTIDHINITDYSINTDSSLSAKFIVRLKFYNPNKKIGIYYEDGSNLTSWYTNTKLCEGSLPTFYQGYQNTTILDVELNGEIQDGMTVLQELYQQQQNGSIPLILDAKVPVKVKLGKLKLMKVKIHVRCNEVVNSLTSNNLISVKTSSCKLKLKL
ncbi:NDR1/HIN1-like protein 6 [Telopea speciosissima]|uniref:NDR1/HIN1-like protein 6 n=1 Tax=Telopea speciosissima TaxID=54955 RepID=UPI001CC4DF4C|nr:NDR1/HIN1-like protein 6 [Telopea speciosissima]